MGERVLITGGAGFIGSHLADALVQAGHEVILFDNLEPQVHGDGRTRPAFNLDLNHRLEIGDVRDPTRLDRLVRLADVVFHLAAMVGVGQSMYQVRRYTDVNAMGMASLLEVLAANRLRGRVRKLLVASSMSIYGEGAYTCESCGNVAPRLRPVEQLKRPSGKFAVRAAARASANGDRRGQTAVSHLDLCHHQARPRGRWPSCSARLTSCQPWRCASSTSTARARRSPIRTPGWRPFSRRACSPGRAGRLRGRPSAARFRPRQRCCAGVHAGHGQSGGPTYQVLNVGTGRPISGAAGGRATRA